MNPVNDSLKPEERVLYALRGLYQRYGYSQFKMSKFEEYDLYVRNKDFLVSDGVITFTDTDGRLMALKPDVTLSIIKNTRQMPGSVQKLYYNENVYRVSGSTRCFKEIMQTGLECIGDVDLYNLCEVISLAAQSLKSIDPGYVLDLSHMGVVSALVDALGLDDERRAAVIACIGEKNADGVRRLCPDRDVSGILALIAAHGPADEVIEALRPWCGAGDAKAALDELSRVTGVLARQRLRGRAGGLLHRQRHELLQRHRVHGLHRRHPHRRALRRPVRQADAAHGPDCPGRGLRHLHGPAGAPERRAKALRRGHPAALRRARGHHGADQGRAR